MPCVDTSIEAAPLQLERSVPGRSRIATWSANSGNRKFFSTAPCGRWRKKQHPEGIVRLRSAVVLKSFPDVGHPAAVALAAGVKLLFCGHHSCGVKEQTGGLVGPKQRRLFLLVHMVDALSGSGRGRRKDASFF